MIATNMCSKSKIYIFFNSFPLELKTFRDFLKNMVKMCLHGFFMEGHFKNCCGQIVAIP